MSKIEIVEVIDKDGNDVTAERRRPNIFKRALGGLGRAASAPFRFAVELVVRRILGATMSGWKTWAAGIVSILSGLLMIAKSIADGDFSLEAFRDGIQLIVIGGGMIGLGHKIDRTIPPGQ